MKFKRQDILPLHSSTTLSCLDLNLSTLLPKGKSFCQLRRKSIPTVENSLLETIDSVSDSSCENSTDSETGHNDSTIVNKKSPETTDSCSCSLDTDSSKLCDSCANNSSSCDSSSEILSNSTTEFEYCMTLTDEERPLHFRCSECYRTDEEVEISRLHHTGVDNLYAFFIQWSPSLYGGEDEIDPKERGFVVIEDEAEEEEEVQVDFVKGRLIRSMSKDWEILNVAEARRRMSILDVEETLPLPDLHGETAILTEEHVATLTKILPARAEGYPWTLIYSSDQNGFSLGTLFRAMQGVDCPTLLVIKDTSNSVFGALTSCPIKYSDHFYGTGESFLYSFFPEFKVYSWSGENNFFIKANKDGLAIGSGKGSFGIWVDGDLYHGRTQHCDTYDNQPLTSQEDFVIKGFEAWGFF